jgi:uncharacterized protein with HEPN domain
MQPEEKRKLLKHLQDAFIAADMVYTDTLELRPDFFRVNNVKWIVERGIQIISEALSRACSLYPGLTIAGLARLNAVRKRIEQQYDLVDPYMLFNIVNKNIPLLIEELKVHIEKLESE